MRVSACSSVVLALMGLSVGCASTTAQGGSGGGGGGESTSGDSTSSTTATTGTGAGGEGGSGCAEDCSLVDTPQCLTAVCDPGTHACKVVPTTGGEACDDGLFCTVGEACENGFCVGGGPQDCGMSAAECASVTCNEATQSCASVPLANGSPCDSTDDLCVVNETCQNGQCVGAPKDCFFAPVPDACHVGVCNPATGQCEPQPGNDGQTCPNDGDLCMVNKTCSGGACLGGVPKDCSAFTNGCNNGVCDAATGDCYSEAIPPGGTCIEATNECNTGVCDMNGNCNPVPTPGVACASATDACNAGSCDAQGLCGAAAVNDGGACNDGNSCTMGETCLAGVCQGGMMGNYVVYFSETFASNAAGWTLGQEWQIGPATASVGSPVGNQDPAMDHTASADNGIAGVVIGGYANKVVHAPYYLESPVIDTSAVPGPLFLEFWRFLNSDYTPYMKNTIDVFDGSTWVNVWQSGPSPAIQDAQWTKLAYEVTAYKNAAMKIRFGFEIGQSGVFTVSSWNVDDIVLANASCN